MFSRRVIVRRGPGLLGAVALGGAAAGTARARRQGPRAEQEQGRMDELRRAVDLKREGALTDEEFEREKRRILGR